MVLTYTMGKTITYTCEKHGERELVLESFERAPASIVCGQAGIGGPCAIVCAMTVPDRLTRWLGEDTWPGRRAA